jgi:hypothetical protein
MAVALVIGQGLLCGLIGWLTFSNSRPAGSDQGPAAVDQMAAPPPAVLRPTATTRPAPSRSTAAPSSKAAAPVRTTRPARSKVPPAPPAPPVRTTPPSRPGPLPPSKSLEPILLPPPAPPAPSWPGPSGFLQQPVTVGERCWPEGAYGLTRERTLVRCDDDRRRHPRWKIV